MTTGSEDYEGLDYRRMNSRFSHYRGSNYRFAQYRGLNYRVHLMGP